MNKPKYNIGDIVYHISPESDPAAIIDINYRFSIAKYTYCVSKGFGDETWVYEQELTETKTFV